MHILAEAFSLRMKCRIGTFPCLMLAPLNTPWHRYCYQLHGTSDPALSQDCSIAGTTPSSSNSHSLKALLLVRLAHLHFCVAHTRAVWQSGNTLFGTMPDQVSAPNLAYLLVSNNPDLSGTVSSALLSLASLKSLLLHGDRLSLPKITSANHSNATLETLSLAHNHFTGTIDALERQTSLKTLLLSGIALHLCTRSVLDSHLGIGNHFSCDVASLDAATGLAQGIVRDPNEVALKSVGEEIRTKGANEIGRETTRTIDPYAGVEIVNRSNTCLVFAGNAQVSALVWRASRTIGGCS